ncbi:hypothetical protein PWG15_13235 [Ensifer adhaerens]|nr:hypothetical protein [Ensifer adhaerens]WDZ75576.1 hypothetical protein PWG15_13235 [Ensifer adhaerens]
MVNDARGDLIGRVARVHLEIVGAMVMRLEVKARFPNGAVAALALTTLELFDRRMDTDPEDIEMRGSHPEILCPNLLLDDVLDDQVVSSLGKSRNRPMKSVEEPRAFAAHAMVHATLEHPKSGVGKLV